MKEIKFRAWDNEEKKMLYYPFGVGLHFDEGEEEVKKLHNRFFGFIKKSKNAKEKWGDD